VPLFNEACPGTVVAQARLAASRAETIPPLLFAIGFQSARNFMAAYATACLYLHRRKEMPALTRPSASEGMGDGLGVESASGK
jgi:hypothetical protein